MMNYNHVFILHTFPNLFNRKMEAGEVQSRRSVPCRSIGHYGIDERTNNADLWRNGCVRF